MLRKIRDVAEWVGQRKPGVDIEVDGNVSNANAPRMVEAGANVLVCGTSSIFKKGVPLADAVAEFRKDIAATG